MELREIRDRAAVLFNDFKEISVTYANNLEDGFYEFMNRRIDDLEDYLFRSAYFLLQLIVPFIIFFIKIFLVFFFSFAIYAAIFIYTYPVDLIEKDIYFDYASGPKPVAKLNLLTSENQWDYYRSGLIVQPHSLAATRFLRPSSDYEISLSFKISKSSKNQDERRSMVTLSLVDASGDVIAMSTRPLIVPYHSPLVSLVTVLWHLPTYVLGASETDVVTLLMMNNFREARSELAAVQTVEVTLSSGGMDVESCNLSIIPLPSGFTYLMYHYPVLAFVLGLVMVSAALAVTFCFISLIRALWRFELIRDIFSSNGKDDDVTDSTDTGDDVGDLAFDEDDIPDDNSAPEVAAEDTATRQGPTPSMRRRSRRI